MIILPCPNKEIACELKRHIATKRIRSAAYLRVRTKSKKYIFQPYERILLALLQHLGLHPPHHRRPLHRNRSPGLVDCCGFPHGFLPESKSVPDWKDVQNRFTLDENPYRRVSLFLWGFLLYIFNVLRRVSVFSKAFFSLMP